ncbi:DUF4198 domain-containing protein [Roseibacillus ishigakijimensis]|uniref:DUF4198 domain-containing protein n=1 Tax=Roseibacillus ishigakijimensis TaxID=454146 RepID=A0A934RQ17_9BACT|nr:DUF4198 domain-containing protein [Roseibacillus ishigakijimensis]MBK1833501.1 DUF4198 domain-containing protein [Roseibacillus ishigakijimensis]
MKFAPLKNWLPALFLAHLPFTAQGHDFALIPKMSGPTLSAVEGRYGHPGAWEKSDPYRLLTLDLHAGGEKSSLLADVITPPAAIPQPVASIAKHEGTVIVTATYDNGYWVAMEDKSYFQTTKKMMAGREGVAGSSHNIKFAKTLVTSAESKGFEAVLGQQLEIVPLANPASLEAGDTLPVGVFFEGKPLPEAKVTVVEITEPMSDSSPSATTDAEGTAQVPLAQGGFLVLRTDHVAEGSTPELADEDHFSATLVLAIGS